VSHLEVKPSRQSDDDWDMDRSRPRGSPALGEAFGSVLAAAQSGAPWALETLYHAVAPAVAGYLWVQGSTDPDDLTSDALYRALSAIRSFSGDEAGFRSWVFAIAHNCLVDERRRRARRPVIAEEGVTDGAGPAADVEDEVLRRLGTERVRRLCALLPPDQRDVLLFRMAAGMTLEETASVLKKSTGAVKSLQHRAVSALRKEFERQGVSL
jgi:RNA polymerase sigma-70 factor (ECF subfamily)